MDRSKCDPIDLPRGSALANPFITNVGLITSHGPVGPNVMAAEWTHLVAHSPGLIAISIGEEKATSCNIRATREFGVNLVTRPHASLARIAGLCSGREIDKVRALAELGLEFYPAKQIGAAMVSGAALNAECRLHLEAPLGSGYVLFVGAVLEASSSDMEPLAYHQGQFWVLERFDANPAPLQRAGEVLPRYRRSTGDSS